MDIALRIKELLGPTAMSQEELAHRVGITISGFHRMNSAGDYKLSVLRKIAKELKTSVSYLIGESADPVGNYLAAEASSWKDKRIADLEEIVGLQKTRIKELEGNKQKA